MQRRGHPRGWQERVGQVNPRPSDISSPHLLSPPSDPDTPAAVVVVTKRKGWGSTGNNESSPMSRESAQFILDKFSPEYFYRYKVSVYLKSSGHIRPTSSRRDISE